MHSSTESSFLHANVEYRVHVQAYSTFFLSIRIAETSSDRHNNYLVLQARNVYRTALWRFDERGFNRDAEICHNMGSGSLWLEYSLVDSPRVLKAPSGSGPYLHCE